MGEASAGGGGGARRAPTRLITLSYDPFRGTLMQSLPLQTFNIHDAKGQKNTWERGGRGVETYRACIKRLKSQSFINCDFFNG